MPGASPSGAGILPLFAETFLLVGRYFIIVYPVFLYFILSSFLLPHTTPDFSHWAWWVVSLGLVAILYIFKAGWSLMMYRAVKEWQVFQQRLLQGPVADADEPFPLPMIPFSLLKEFIPGMGQYGLTFLLGGILWALCVITPIGLLVWGAYHWIGSPEFILPLYNQNTLTFQDFQQFWDRLPMHQKTQLSQWNLVSMAAMGILFIVNALTLYWQQYVILKDTHAFKAFWLSARRAVRHPFQTVLILVYFWTFYLFFSLVGNMSDVLAFLGIFLLILTMVYFGLFLFLYLLRIDAEATP